MLLLFLLTPKLHAEFIYKVSARAHSSYVSLSNNHERFQFQSQLSLVALSWFNSFSFIPACVGDPFFSIPACVDDPFFPFRLSILCFIYFRLIWKIYHLLDTRFARKTALEKEDLYDIFDLSHKLYLWKRKIILGTSNHIEWGHQRHLNVIKN